MIIPIMIIKIITICWQKEVEILVNFARIFSNDIKICIAKICCVDFEER